MKVEEAVDKTQRMRQNAQSSKCEGGSRHEKSHIVELYYTVGNDSCCHILFSWRFWGNARGTPNGNAGMGNVACAESNARSAGARLYSFASAGIQTSANARTKCSGNRKRDSR
jgi:hypothetical protein